MLVAAVLRTGCNGCPLPPDTQCQCELNADNQHIINCRGKQLLEIPKFTNDSLEVYELTLHGCIITDVPANAFSVLHVQRIDLGNNPIRSIHPDAFKGIGDTLTDLILHVDQYNPPAFPTQALSSLPSLQLLHISKFDMPSLPSGALASLSNLQELSITNSKLGGLSPSDFSSQGNSLQVLDLKTNALNRLPVQALGVLNKLQKLDLTLNGMTEDISTNAFINNVQLQEIDLSNNQIYPIRDGAFSGITQSLKTLHIRSNKLTRFDLDKIGTLRVLEDLDLSYNGDLTALDSGVFINMHQLKKLNLHGCYIGALTAESFSGIKDSLVILQIADNKISSIGPGTFSGFTKLEDLYLDHQPLGNVLTETTFSGLENVLRELSLEETEFTSQSWSAVKQLATLTKLKLKNNQIGSVPEFTLEKLTNLQTLDLSLNTISGISQRSLRGPHNSLTSIEFATNMLTTIDKCVFDGFVALKHIGLKNNPLHCDCNLSWLRERIADLTDIERIILQWKCNTPAEHHNKDFVSLTVQELDSTCTTPPPPIQCEVFTSTTASTTTSSTTSTTTYSSTVRGTTTNSIPNPTTYPLLVNVSEVTASTSKVNWNTGEVGFIENFVIDVTLKDSNHPVSTHTAERWERDFLLEDLKPATDYKVCVTMWRKVDGLLEDEIGCADFSTKTTKSPVVQANSNLPVILGVIFGLLGLIILLVILAYFVLKYKGLTLQNIFEKCTGKKKTNSGSPGHGRSKKPTMGDHSQRFSKAKHTSQEIHNQNLANKNVEHFKNFNLEPPYKSNGVGSYSYNQHPYKHIDLHRDLERFSPDERERILNMLTHSGGSHLSTISVGSQRYVPEPPPRPLEIEGYLDPTPLDGDAGYEEPHVYVEIDDQPQISKECYI